MRRGLGTTEAAFGRVGRVGVGEHEEGVSGREVRGIARMAERYPFHKARLTHGKAPTMPSLYVHLSAYLNRGKVCMLVVFPF